MGKTMRTSNFEKEENLFSVDDEYKDKPLKFKDYGDYYEVIFVDEFIMPNKDYTYATDLFLDLKNADKSKELHIYINSQGGECANLLMIIQQVLEFKHCVTIVIGDALSAGFLLFLCGKERYVSPFCSLMSHGITGECDCKANEIISVGNHLKKIDQILIDTLNIKDILSPEEIEKSRTTELWFTGSDFIERGIAKDYRFFKSRVTVGTEDFATKNDRYFKKDGDLFLEYTKTDNKFSYIDLVNLKEGEKS